MSDDAVSRERWTVDIGDGGWYLKSPDDYYWGLNKEYSHPEKLGRRINELQQAHNDRAALEARKADVVVQRLGKTLRERLAAAEQALTAERERANELARKLDAELLRRDTERPIWKEQLQAEREKAALWRRLLTNVMPVARAGLVGLERVGNEGVYRRIEEAQAAVDDALAEHTGDHVFTPTTEAAKKRGPWTPEIERDLNRG